MNLPPDPQQPAPVHAAEPARGHDEGAAETEQEVGTHPQVDGGPPEGAAAVPAGEGLQAVRVASGETRSLLPPEAVLLGARREEEALGT